MFFFAMQRRIKRIHIIPLDSRDERNQRMKRLGLIVAVLLIGTLAINTMALQKTHKTMVGKQAPAWKIKASIDEDAKTKVEDYKGKWLLVEFWFPG